MPAELRDDGFALILRTTVAGLPQAIREAARTDDTGYVSVVLPTGTTVGTQVSVNDVRMASPEAVCRTLGELPAVSSFLATEGRPFATASLSPFSAPCAERTSAAAEVDRFAAGARCRLIPGSGVRQEDAAGVELPVDPAPIHVARSAGQSAATVSLHLGDRTPLCVVVCPGAEVRLSPKPEPLGVLLTTGDAVIDDMMRLRAAGRIPEVAAILGGLGADDVLRRLDEQPAAAVLIGYGLLRTAASALLVQAFAQAARRRPGFADLAVLAGEAAAREGRHEDALDWFLKASHAGLPAFSFGVNYLIDRLRYYGPRSGGPTLDEGLAAQARAACDAVQIYGPAMLHGAALTTYVLAAPVDPPGPDLRPPP